MDLFWLKWFVSIVSVYFSRLFTQDQSAVYCLIVKSSITSTLLDALVSGKFSQPAIYISVIMKKVDRILVVRFSSLGDIILLTPIFREIKNIFPNATIDFLTASTFAGICQNNPHIDQIIQLDRKKGNEDFSRIRKLCKANRYDLIFDAHQSLRSRLLLTNLHGPFYRYRSGIYCIDKRSFKRNILLLTGINFLKNAVAQREAYCLLLNSFSELEQLVTNTELFPGELEIQRVQEIFSKEQLASENLVAIGPGSSFPGKSWPKEYYLELTKLLQNEGYQVVILGSPGEIEPKFIYDRSRQKPLNLAGELSILESAEILRHCRLTISNDSAIVHMSEAMATPAISIFGPTVKEFGYSPYLKDSQRIEISLKCRPCSRNGKGECKIRIKRQCLRDISVNKVMDSALQILKGHVTNK